MGITTIKRIHNLVSTRVDGGITTTIVNVERNRSLLPDFEFTRREDRDVDWPIPWAWEEAHFNWDRRHIDIRITGRPEVFSIWQQDDEIWMTENGTFTGPRISLGGIDGSRRLVITDAGVQLIGMYDPLPNPPDTRNCLLVQNPYTLHSSGGEDARAESAGTIMLRNEIWFARYHQVEAGFGKRVFFPNGGRPMQIEAKWNLSPSMLANGVGYARARLILRLEVSLEDIRTGLLSAPIVREQTFKNQTIVFGFHPMAGNVPPEDAAISLNTDQQPQTDYFVVRALVKSEVGGGGWVNARASCSGDFFGFTFCRL